LLNAREKTPFVNYKNYRLQLPGGGVAKIKP